MSKWTRANPLAAVPGYKVPAGHFANGYTNGGDRVNFRVGGRVALKEGKSADKNWIQKAVKKLKHMRDTKRAFKIGKTQTFPHDPAQGSSEWKKYK